VELKYLDEILAMTSVGRKSVMAVAGAGKAAVVDAVLDAVDKGATDAILVGEREDIRSLLRERERNVSDFNIVATAAGQTPAETAVELIREGSANFLMTGMV
jgi:phosphate butyryltransferase